MPSAPRSAIITPRRTLPRTSPAMYAEYWKPMNWNSRIDRTNGNTLVEKRSLRTWWEVPAMKSALPDAAIFAAVTPPV